MTEPEANRVTDEEREFILEWARECYHGVIGPARKVIRGWGILEIEMSGMVAALRMPFEVETLEAEKEPREVKTPWATLEQFQERRTAITHRVS